MIPDHIKDQLDPAFLAWLEATQIPLPPGFEPTLEQMRAGFIQQMEPYNGPTDPNLVTRDTVVVGRDGHSIPLRIYQHRAATEAAPACFFLHGGGWVLGNLETHRGLCSDIAIQTGTTVIAIDYRLSPEYEFPAALNDCIDAVEHVHQHSTEFAIDAKKLAIVGDSAGASLAAATSLVMREKPIELSAQALIYPALGADLSLPSFTENAEVPGLSESEMVFFFTSYIGGEDLPDPLAAPLTVKDISNLPPTFITVAQFDPLRDDGIHFARRLQAAGVENIIRTEPGLGHSFMWVRHSSPIAAAALEALCAFLSSKL